MKVLQLPCTILQLPTKLQFFKINFFEDQIKVQHRERHPWIPLFPVQHHRENHLYETGTRKDRVKTRASTSARKHHTQGTSVLKPK